MELRIPSTALGSTIHPLLQASATGNVIDLQMVILFISCLG